MTENISEDLGVRSQGFVIEEDSCKEKDFRYDLLSFCVIQYIYMSSEEDILLNLYETIQDHMIVYIYASAIYLI